MSLTLKVISENRQALGERSEKTFGQAGGTIGRSLEADWSLPDGQRFLSSKHASIDYRSGCYYIVDTSKNGVYVNGAEQPVGHGKPQRLFTGDKIRIGEYMMQVSIVSVDDTRETMLDTGHVDPVDRKQRVEAPEPAGLDLIDAQTITGVGFDFSFEDDDSEALKPLYEKYRTGSTSGSLRLVEEVPPAAKPAAAKPAAAPAPVAAKLSPAKPAPAPTAPKAPVARPAPANPAYSRPAASKPAAANPAPVSAAPANPAPAAPTPIRKTGVAGAADRGAERALLEAFFRGAGIDAPAMNPRQTEQFMTQLGQVSRELIAGVIDSLHLRAVQKAQLKQANTTIQKLDNNRLKFAANVEEGFAKLFGDESEQYQSPVDSVRNAYAELKHHQRALLAATRRALDGYLNRLEPGQIENRAGGIGGALRNAANKFKYWDLYKDVYSVLANRAADEMPQAFLDELSTAYADEIAKSAPKSQTNATSKEAR